MVPSSSRCQQLLPSPPQPPGTHRAQERSSDNPTMARSVRRGSSLRGIWNGTRVDFGKEMKEKKGISEGCPWPESEGDALQVGVVSTPRINAGLQRCPGCRELSLWSGRGSPCWSGLHFRSGAASFARLPSPRAPRPRGCPSASRTAHRLRGGPGRG